MQIRWLDLDNPADLASFQAQDPVFYLNHYNHNLIIDEAQAYLAVFDILRGIIDAKRERTFSRQWFIKLFIAHPQSG